MYRYALRIGGLLLLIAAGVVGCSKTTTAPITTNTDQSQVNTLLAQNGGLVDDNTSTTSETEAFSARPAGATGSLALVHPIFYWRTLTSQTRTFDIAFADTDSTGHPRYALVTVQRHLLGTFNVIPSQSSDSTAADTARAIHKALDDHWVRHVLLKRVRMGSSDETRWRFAGTSVVDIYSERTGLVGQTTIQSVRVQSSTLDTTITDPAALYLLRKVLRVSPDDSVLVTVTTNHPDDAVLVHHADHRRLFRNNGDNTYTIRWRSGPLSGWRHFGIDAIAHATLFTDTAGYDADRWIIPFAVASDPVADYYP